ncbi:cardioacceleratory peptide receptor-like isoform X1 [Octopus vulgaris]|uniref:Cardioacceleratory peptide receptor-like isoform X1 n=1 Tax=Octopus vulgaris TaxID=6645 RepID=A0AA36BSC9_OCTVU|nr:cardioacceleratory peptide receptor-like isoform X1 [Octopus vulgaris]
MEIYSEANLLNNKLIWNQSDQTSTEITTINIDYTLDSFELRNNTLLEEGNKNMHFYKVEQLTFLWILLILIVVCNCFVLRVVLPARLRGSSRMNFFVMHLAIADLSNGLICVLPDIIWKMTLSWYAGNVMCKVVKFFQEVVVFASTYVLVSLSLDRLDAIARPLRFTGSGTRSRILVASAWGCAIIFSCPSLFLFKETTNPFDESIKLCYLHLTEPWHWMVYITLLAVALFIIPTIIIIICYTTIIYVIWNNGKMLLGMEGSNASDHSQKRWKHQTKTAFITCWSPYMIFCLLQVYGMIPNTHTMLAVATFFQSLAPLNSVANPIIYGIFNLCDCKNTRNAACCSEMICKCFYDRRARKTTTFRSVTSGYTTVVETNFTHREHLEQTASRRDSGVPYVKSAISETERKILLRNLNTIAPEKIKNRKSIRESKL